MIIFTTSWIRLYLTITDNVTLNAHKWYFIVWSHCYRTFLCIPINIQKKINKEYSTATSTRQGSNYKRNMISTVATIGRQLVTFESHQFDQ